MTTALRTVLPTARAHRAARHLTGASFCDSCAQVSDSATRVAERRQQTLIAFTYAR
ncbi:hypothetical protein OH738_01370 [Streptomyces hirsutus]|uniref:Uncharacterized protein n=1 Tax=Streptomyces hirsutus TaxID=35620 RepID=A0ABZ1H0W4_9ACTN|nr:hypothetical protein [Streptomyces hirsutus]WSD11020.1 hypothetical protein OIE73_38620 [Streptomyces hirsutus]WTD15633.1 hypothetical protein OH738_01370 [Streptomyces hirsutus]